MATAILSEPYNGKHLSIDTHQDANIRTKDTTPVFHKLPSTNSTRTQSSGPRTIEPPFILEDHPVDESLSIKAIVVGAGITGITAGVLLPIKVPGLQLQIYERHPDIVSYLLHRNESAVMCPPMKVYQSTFSPTTAWTENYSRGSEIKDYWKSLANKYDIWKYVKLRSEVLRATWSEMKGKWIVEIKQTDEQTRRSVVLHDEAEFLVTSTGRFSSPKLPDIPGLGEFQGPVIHTSAWDNAFDPTGKKLALIGNGASGLQILPQLQKMASHVDHYTRNPTWVAGTLGAEKLSRDVPIPEELKTRWAENPHEYHQYRKDLEAQAWTRFAIVERGGAKNQSARVDFEKLMSTRLGDRQDLKPLVIPEFPPNCRRLTPGPGYLEAVTQSNVSYIRTPILSATPLGIQTQQGEERPVDAIICATGADIAKTPAFPIVNARGENLQNTWRHGGDPGFPDTYLGMAAAEFPNLFFLMGPNAGAGFAGTLPHAVENQVTYVAKILRKASSQRIRTIVPSQAAVRDFRAYCESFFPRTVISDGCSSWYNNHTEGGRIVAVWPGSGSHVNHVRREVRWEDFEYTYHNRQNNRFGYFGNGWTARDVASRDYGDQAQDLSDFTPYLKVEARIEGGVDLRGYHEAWYEV
ncbi:hypothetical protein FE257_004464 [Aspergillus nanangensis]|uniref:FAD/NAD(P)-binding domain-containing protein n=1 Tax=Aspergillus nanangensis TaxID=2582783 RepID=A0AAD4CZU2_ASPNN|nr:hypothetical protein FE257_004464 [Aspergillus nanangensis]